jgi:ketosteroid isomerase-like protein
MSNRHSFDKPEVMMNPNKQLLRHIYDELSRGNGKPFTDALADDAVWTITGSSAWSRSYRGKQAIRDELLTPLFAQFAGQYTNSAQRIIAEDDLVVVECRGQVTTKSGNPYNNSYCYIYRVEGGKIRELTEYLDTALLAKALADPA